MVVWVVSLSAPCAGRRSTPHGEVASQGLLWLLQHPGVPRGQPGSRAHVYAPERMTKCSGMLVLKVGPQRQLARPLSAVQEQFLVALWVPVTWFMLPAG